MNIHSLQSSPLQSLQGPLHAVGLVGHNKPVTVTSVARPVFETMQAGATYIASKLTLSKLVKASILLGAVQALSTFPGADAGALCFYLCMPTCLSATGGAFPPACVVACAGACGWHPV